MSFNCSFNVANGTQTLLILPDISFSGHKKANVEVNTVSGLLRPAEPTGESVEQTPRLLSRDQHFDLVPGTRLIGW